MSKKSDSSLKDNQKNQRIQVFARTRPLNGSETKQHSRNVLEVCPEKKEVRVRDGKMINKAFAFDRVFGPETSQIHVYQAVVGPLIQEVLMGYNCTVFAYGQTSTGKTFTMEGERSDKTCTWEEDPKAGIIPRSLHQLFEELYKEESVEFSVHVSFLELYNEELFDLLSPNDVQIVKLRLFEDSSRKGSVVIQGLEEIKVNSKDEVYAILERGTVRRQTAATHLNASSSRSHTVFSVTVHIKENTIDGEELLKTGKLNLVDLAGSENIGRSGASQKTAREAGNINQSLLTLGRVITALVEKAPHIPYRESKLTRLLQDSLGGHTKTSIIATVSPASCNIEETISTLDYAQRAKSITIKPEVNQKMTKKALIKEYTEEIERLRKDVMAARDNNLGVFIHRDNYQAMEELKESYANAIIKNKELFDNLAETQNILEDTKVELNATTNKYNERTTECEKLKEKLSEVLEALKLTQQARDAAVVKRDENQYIIDVRKEIENKLTHQAQALLQVADESTKNLSATFDVIDRKKCVDETNNEQSRDFEVKFQHKLEVMNGIIAQMAVEQSNNLNSVEEDIGAVLESCEKYYSTFRNSLIEDFEKEFLYQAKTTTEFFSSNAEEHMMFCDNNASKVADLQLHNKALADGLKLLREKHSLMREGWTSLMTNLTQLLLTFRMQTKTKLQELEVRTQSSALSHKQLTNDLAAMLKESSSKHLEQLQWCIDQISLNTTKNQEFDKKREENFEIMLNALTTIQTLNKEKDQISNKQAIQCSDALSQIIENIKITCLEHSRKVDVSNEETDMKNTELLALHQDLYKAYENQEEQVKEECVSMSTEQIKIIDETMTICQSHQDVLNTQDQVIKDVCELTVKEKTNLEENKKKYLQHVDEAKTVADGQISGIKLHVKVQEEHIISRFNGQLGLVSKSRKRLLESTDTLKNECSDCGTQMKKFLGEDLQKDISSGNTPKRKCYIISHELAATSPHEKLLERRRLQLDLSNETSTTKNGRLDSSSDNSSTSPLLLRRTQSSKESLSVIDNDSSSGEESPAAYSDTYSSQSDLTSDSTKNKENQHLSKKSKIPKKRSPRKGLTKPQPLVRKPLSSSNVTLHE